MEWSERSPGAKSTVSNRVITIKWSNDSAEKGIETSFRSKEVGELARWGCRVLRQRMEKIVSLVRSRYKIDHDRSVPREDLENRHGSNGWKSVARRSTNHFSLSIQRRQSKFECHELTYR